MKSTTCVVRQATTATVILAVDVSKAKLNLYTEIGSLAVEEVIVNRTPAIEDALRRLRDRARRACAERLLVVCEASGRYQDTLMRTARNLGCETAWVGGEAVAKMRVVETNDTGKTDLKDPRVIHTLARMGKILTHRTLNAPYGMLREWHRTYEAAEAGMAEAKSALHQQLQALFPDFSFKKDFPFRRSGRALIEAFGANPHRIRAAGRARFDQTMKRRAPGVHRRSLERLWTEAEASLRHGSAPDVAAVLEVRLRQIWEDHDRCAERKAEARAAMECLYREARALDPQLPEERKGVISTFHLGRIVAETGPLHDFGSTRSLVRFAGLNLRERQSGLFRGQTRISKKGRRPLRKVLGQIVLPLVTRKGLYGRYFHQKRQTMPGAKAMTAVMRKFLKMLFGWYRSGVAFQPDRVFTCRSQYCLAA